MFINYKPMKRNSKSGVVLLSIILISSCGGNKTAKNGITPMTTTISGDLSECYEVVDRAYKITENSMFDLLTVEIKRTDAPLPFDSDKLEIASYSHEMFAPNVQIGFGIEFRDRDGNVLEKVSATASGLSGSYSSDDPVELGKLRPGETGTIRFSVQDDIKDAVMQFKVTSACKVKGGSFSHKSSASSTGTPGDYPEGSDELLSEDDLDGYSAEELKIIRNEIYARHGYIFQAADLIEHFSGESWYDGTNASATAVYNTFSEIEKKNVELIKALEKTAPKTSFRNNSAKSSSIGIGMDSNDSSAYSSSGSKQWDKILDEYESLVNKYISLAKKAAKGNPTAVLECASILAKTEKLSDRLDKAEEDDDLSISQAKRFLKLTNKLTEAVFEITEGAMEMGDDLLNLLD